MARPRPYGLWWQMAESCSGKRGLLSNIHWYYVPGATLIDVGGREYHGFWFQDRQAIVLAERSVPDGQLVRHEMLHALAGPQHSRVDFVDACGGVVACTDQCFEEAGGPEQPPVDAPHIAGSAIVTELQVDPPNPSFEADSGWIGILVTARNPLSTGAWGDLAPIEGASSFSATFGYVVDCVPSCSEPVASAYDFVRGSTFGFASRGRQQRLFDLRLSSGSYSVRGFFNTDTAAAIVISIAR